jgi:ADP-ribose pyrophosphatase YjhB (NUDIX family)
MSTTHLLARAVVRDAGHVLLVRAEGQSHTFLPGGHVEAGEGLVDCLRRELREELDLTASVGAYRGAVEHRWRRNGERQYEINHCFAVDLPSVTAENRPAAQEEYLRFGWVPAEQTSLAEADLQPAPLRRLLTNEDAAEQPWWAPTLATSPSDPGPSPNA